MEIESLSCKLCVCLTVCVLICLLLIGILLLIGVLGVQGRTARCTEFDTCCVLSTAVGTTNCLRLVIHRGAARCAEVNAIRVLCAAVFTIHDRILQNFFRCRLCCIHAAATCFDAEKPAGFVCLTSMYGMCRVYVCFRYN